MGIMRTRWARSSVAVVAVALVVRLAIGPDPHGWLGVPGVLSAMVLGVAVIAVAVAAFMAIPVWLSRPGRAR